MPNNVIELHSLTIRILHWVQAITVFILIIAGLHLHHPTLLNIPLSTVREVKGIFNFVLIANLLIYIYYSFITRHYSDLIFSLKDIPFIPSFFKYMFFIKESPGYYGKYNPGQKATYTMWFIVFLIQIVTGLTLFFPEQLGFLIPLLGGLNRIRMIHYFMTWVLIATIPIHIYLAITEDPAKLQSIFTGKARRG